MKTVIRINSRCSGPGKGPEDYVLVNPEFCEVCGHEIPDDDQEYCDWCGEPVEKVRRPAGKSGTGSGGGWLFLGFVLVIVIWLLVK